jgi:phosphinothricin acetyltransferase
MEYQLEDMGEEHREAVIDVYNYFIENTFAAYPEETVEYQFFDYFIGMTKGYPAIVVKNDAGVVVGFAFLSAVSIAETFQNTAGISYFIMPEYTRHGIGRTILDRFEAEAAKMEIESILAHISSLNPDSVKFHERNGFVECGRFQNVGTKFGRSFDVIWMQKRVK